MLRPHHFETHTIPLGGTLDVDLDRASKIVDVYRVDGGDVLALVVLRGDAAATQPYRLRVYSTDMLVPFGEWAHLRSVDGLHLFQSMHDSWALSR